MAPSPGLWLYLALARRAEGPLRRRVRRVGKRAGLSPDRISQRLAEDLPPRPPGDVIWFHAAEGTRMPAFYQLIARLNDMPGDMTALVTTDGLDQAPGTAIPGVVHCLRPVDLPPVIDRFLDHWQPSVAVFSGSDLWPATIMACDRDGIPLLMFDAHLRSARITRWRWAPLAIRALLGRFRHFLTGSQVDAEELRHYGAPAWKVEVPGFLEESTSALPCNEAERDALGALLAVRPVWAAARITTREAPAVETAHRQAARHSHRLLLIVVPDNPANGPELARLFAQAGWNTVLRSDGAEPDEDVQIYIADTEDEMGLWYRLAPITFIGNSLVSPGGGHDPYEPAALGSAVLHGPHITRHQAVFDRMDTVGAARSVANAAQLGEAVAELLAPDKTAEMAHKAWEVSSEGAEVADRALELIVDAITEKANL